MNNILTMCAKEFRGYFTSPIGWLLIAMFAVINGFFFWNVVGYMAVMGQRQMMMGGGGNMNVNEMVIRPLLQNMAVIGLFLIPLITMRLFAEEKRQGTAELLLTSPISDFEILFGKWLSALAMYALMIGFSSLVFIFLFIHSTPDWRPMLVGYLGLLLQAGGLLAIGLFISTTTKNQIIAGAVTFAACLMLWIFEWVAGYEQAAWAKVMAYMSITTHMESFAKGVLDSKDVVYYLSVIVFGLFLAGRSLESLRWRA
jgi:ABC-2 type transport system permease protein